MDISQAPHGINLVVETQNMVYIGRFDRIADEEVRLQHASMHRVVDEEEGQSIIREAAKFGVPVQHNELAFPSRGIFRVRRLGDIVK